jgi:O-antigen/teichoic acid export membrane protein
MVFENCIVLISVLFSRDILFAISLYTGLRLLGTTLMAFHIKKKAPWFVYGFRHVRISIIKKSVLPSISLILIHISNALTVQGIVTLIGIRLGASAVVSFSVIRTVINLVKQFNSMIYYSILPEFSTSIATGDLGTTKKLHRMACQSSLYFTVFNIVLLLFFGEPVIRIWTNGNFEPDFAFMALMLISMLPNTFYVTSSYVHISINRLGKLSLLSLVSAITALVLIGIMLPVAGLNIVPIVLMIVDSILLFIIVRDTLFLVKDDVRSFAIAMFDFTHIRHLRTLYRTLVKQ